MVWRRYLFLSISISVTFVDPLFYACADGQWWRAGFYVYHHRYMRCVSYVFRLEVTPWHDCLIKTSDRRAWPHEIHTERVLNLCKRFARIYWYIRILTTGKCSFVSHPSNYNHQYERVYSLALKRMHSAAHPLRLNWFGIELREILCEIVEIVQRKRTYWTQIIDTT